MIFVKDVEKLGFYSVDIRTDYHSDGLDKTEDRHN